MENEVWISLRKADARLHVRSGTCAAAVERGELPAYAAPGSRARRVRAIDVDGWMLQHPVVPSAPGAELFIG